MPGNKKRKKFNSNNSHAGKRFRERASSAAPITVKDKKKELIRQRILSDGTKLRGMKALGIIVAAIILSRAALFIYELAYYISIGVKVNVFSNILLLPLLLILLMVKDGNRGLIGICSVSALVRLIYLFVSMYPALKSYGGAEAFVAVWAAVMAVQFILSVTALSMPSADLYSKEMQKINFEIRSLIMKSRK